MAKIKVDKVVSALPDPLVKDTIYAVRVGTGFDLYLTDSTGSTAHKINQFPYDDSTPPTTGQTVKFDGTNFVPADFPAGGGGGGTTATEVTTLTSDFSLVSETSPQSVANMRSITIPANKNVTIIGMILHNSGTTPDGVFDLNAAVGSIVEGEIKTDLDAVFSAGTPIGTGLFIQGSGGSSPRLAAIMGYLKTGGSETEIECTWAQSSSSTSASIIVEGSWLQLSWEL